MQYHVLCVFTRAVHSLFSQQCHVADSTTPSTLPLVIVFHNVLFHVISKLP